MAWKKGPLPAGTFGWGAVVPFDMDGAGFLFADFAGDKVTTNPGNRILKAHEVKAYDNSLELPPKEVLT